MEKKYASVDIGGTSIKIGLYAENGGFIEKWAIPTDISDNGTHIIPDIAKSIAEHTAPCFPDGICLGVPGPVSAEAKVAHAVNLGWGACTPCEELKKLLPGVKHIVAANDADLAALGEYWKGAGAGYKSTYFITLGTGVGGGFVCEGRIFAGNGAAGEIGHITINCNETTHCTCGNTGCCEQYASARGMVLTAKRLLQLKKYGMQYEDGRITFPAAAGEIPDPAASPYDGVTHIETLIKPEIPKEPSRLEELEDFTAEDICRLASEGDSFCLYVLDIAGRCLGMCLSTISCVLDPEVYIIGGGLSNGGDVVFDALRRGFAAYVPEVCKSTILVKAELGNDAGMYGGVKLLMDKE